MIIDVEFISLEVARGREPRHDTLLISILDREEAARHKRPRLGGWRSVLGLDFEDASENDHRPEDGYWPDDPDEVDHARFSQTMGERVPALADATRMVEFIMGHHALEQNLRLVIHCRAGQSRSNAVAEWVSRTLGVLKIDEAGVSPDWANKRVLRLLDKAYAQYQRDLAVEMGLEPAAATPVDTPRTDLGGESGAKRERHSMD